MLTYIRRYLVAGLLVWFPIWVTFLAIHFLIRTVDQTLKLLPSAYQPDQWLGLHIPGLGLVFTFIVLFITGMVVRNFLGNKLVKIWDSLINRIPLVRSIYMGVKKTLETMVNSKTEAFRKVLLIQYPSQGVWSIAFQTGVTCPAIINAAKTGEEMVTVFLPTTPNPTSGFMLVLPKKNAIELDISIDDALKMVISLGVVQPFHQKLEVPENNTG
jgi:uncharacterized membrane protein